MDLNRASTFVRVVEAGSFSAAASHLGLRTSSVSRSVARLEDELGVVLLERTTRRLALTDAGRAYYDRARDALSGLAEAGALAVEAAREPRGPVRVAAPPPFSTLLAREVVSFAAKHPLVTIDVRFTMRAAEAIGEHADVAIAFGRLADSGLVARRVGDSRETLVAAPSYLARRGAPAHPRDLAEHAILDAHEHAWELDGPDGPHVLATTAKIAGDDFDFLVAAASAGVGIALLPAIVTSAARARGELVEVLPGVGRSQPMYVVTRPPRLLARRVALFRDHVIAALSAHSCSE